MTAEEEDVFVFVLGSRDQLPNELPKSFGQVKGPSDMTV
jgi:hypothetical protein